MLTYSMDRRGRQTKYAYLASCLKHDILKGILKAGERLPAKRPLAAHLGISVVTVEAAYGQLLDEGYLNVRDRSGFYVNPLQLPTAHPEVAEHPHPALPPAALSASSAGPSPLPPAFSTAPSALSSASAFSSLSPDFPITPFLRIVREVLNDYREQLLTRSPNAGTIELRTAISDYLKRYRGMRTKPEQIIIGSGSEYLYGFVAQLFDRQIVYGIESQSYEKIRLVYSAYARPYELLPMDRFGVRTEGLQRSRASVLHVTPFHSYPTGITAPAGKRYEYLAWAKERSAFLVEDDFESEFSVQRKPLETIYAMDQADSVIYLNTFTRSIAPSMRIGYMVLPERLLKLYQQKLGFYSCTVPSLDQYVLAEYIAQGHFEKRLNRIRRLQKQRQTG